MSEPELDRIEDFWNPVPPLCYSGAVYIAFSGVLGSWPRVDLHLGRNPASWFLSQPRLDSRKLLQVALSTVDWPILGMFPTPDIIPNVDPIYSTALWKPGYWEDASTAPGKEEMELRWVTIVSDICKAIPPAVRLTFPGYLPSFLWCSMLREVTGASELPQVAIHGALLFPTAFWPVLLPGIHTPRWGCSEVLSAQKVHCQKAQSTHHIPCGSHRMFLRHIETQKSPFLQFVSIKTYIPFFF